jgi:hypothetical protein
MSEHLPLPDPARSRRTALRRRSQLARFRAAPTSTVSCPRQLPPTSAPLGLRAA